MSKKEDLIKKMAEYSAIIGDRFSLGDCLGKGAFAVVFSAYDNIKKQNVALKVILFALNLR
jgi:serine/threonine protein kinase